VDPMTVFLTSLGSAAGRRATKEGLDLLREAVGLQRAEIELLRSINAKLDALLARPFKTGVRQMEDALASWRDENDRRRLLEEARSSFTEAVSEDPEPLRRSFASLHLAAVWLYLGSPEDVPKHLREAQISAAFVLHKQVKTVSLEWVRLMATDRRAVPRRNLLPYFNQLAAARRAWNPHIIAPMVVDKLPDGTWSVPGVSGIDTEEIRASIELPPGQHQYRKYFEHEGVWTWTLYERDPYWYRRWLDE
jgi:hypothetical protein